MCVGKGAMLSKQSDRQRHASPARAVRKGGGGGMGVRTGSWALRPFPLILLPVCEITEEQRRCLGFNMKPVHDSQVPLEQMNVFPAWLVSRDSQG